MEEQENPAVSFAAQSPTHMFQNATDFGIHGSQFTNVLGNININPISSLSEGQPGTAVNPAGAVNASLDALGLTGTYSESGSYSAQLLRRGRGFPLYIPDPQQNLPAEYRRRGVSIGDVGRITPEGIFDFFFNIYLPADHAINANDVPEDFSPLSLYVSKDIVHLDFEPGSHVSTPSIQKLDLEPPFDEFPGGEYLFNCDGPHGAVLALPYGAHLEKLENLEAVRRYAAKHAESWYKYINGARGRGLANGSLYLVTGCEKSRSWGMASFQDVTARGQFQLAFKPNTVVATGFRYRWRATGPASKKALGSPLANGQLLIKHLFGDVEICQIVDSPLGRPGHRFVPYGSQGSSFSWSLGFFGGSGRGGNADNVVVSELAPISKLFHPSQLINDYLLAKAPQTRSVITHDDDWCHVLRDEGAGSIAQNSAQLIEEISNRFNVVEQEGAIFLVPKSESTLPHGRHREPQTSSSHVGESSPHVFGPLGPRSLSSKRMSLDSSIGINQLPRKTHIIRKSITHRIRDSAPRRDYDLSRDSDVNRSDSFPERYAVSDMDIIEPIGSDNLPFRPRTTTLSTTSSVSTASSTEDGIFNRQPTSTFIPAVPSSRIGRTRSGSLGASYASYPNTHVSDLSVPNRDTLTLLVVGAARCGKSVVTRKGLKDYGLSEPTSHSFEVLCPDFSANYSLRVGHVRDDFEEYPLHVLEADVSKTTLDDAVCPDGSPAIEGVIVCYDASDPDSFLPVEGLLQRYRAMMIPTVVLACKSDLEHRVDPQRAAAHFLQLYDNGLVEVSNTQESGKKKMRQAFEWLIKAVFRSRHASKNESDIDYRNPASPVLFISPPPWETPRTVSPVASSFVSSTRTLSQGQSTLATERSTGNLSSEHEKSRTMVWHIGKEAALIARSDSNMIQRQKISSTSNEPTDIVVDLPPKKDASSGSWATLDELLDKLLFLAVSGDDPTYITRFLLTYRRFASPRSVILAMQLRIRQLDQPSGDPMFACFAQTRICDFLEKWIRDYPYDFIVRGTPSALSALFKSITSKTYLLHCSSDFLPFHESLQNLVDKDAAWAHKPDYPEDESDDDGDDGSTVSSTHSSELESLPPSAKTTPTIPATFRERKGSLLLGSRLLIPSGITHNESTEGNNRIRLKDLFNLAADVNGADSEDIAQEITRIEVKLFLAIEPRHWLRFIFVSGKKDPFTDSIARFNDFSNHLADWVASLILCHDKAKTRAKQIEKIVEIAQKLRGLNNYSALRAFVAGINHSTFPGDETMEHFKSKSPVHAKNLQSWDILLQQIRAHRAYRLALRNTKGACIPALEVHMSDLIRAHEANDDINPMDSTKIHWGKFNMMGRFINTITECQAQCRAVDDYSFPPRQHISDMLLTLVMDDEMQKSRIAPLDADLPSTPRIISRDNPSLGIPTRDITRMRKLFSW